MRNKIIAVVLSVLGVTTIGYGAFAVSGNSKPESPTFTESSCMPSPCKQLLPPAWSSSTTVTTAPKQAESAVATSSPTSTSTKPVTTTAQPTTTTEAPAQLTQEQADTIQGMPTCAAIDQTGCVKPESEGMSDENINGTDSDQ